MAWLYLPWTSKYSHLRKLCGMADITAPDGTRSGPPGRRAAATKGASLKHRQGPGSCRAMASYVLASHLTAQTRRRETSDQHGSAIQSSLQVSCCHRKLIRTVWPHTPNPSDQQEISESPTKNPTGGTVGGREAVKVLTLIYF